MALGLRRVTHAPAPVTLARAGGRRRVDYVQITPKQRDEMLRAVGATSIDDLLRPLRESTREPAPPLDLPPALDEMSLRSHVSDLAARNTTVRQKTCFLGAAAYDHFIPAVVDALANE